MKVVFTQMSSYWFLLALLSVYCVEGNASDAPKARMDGTVELSTSSFDAFVGHNRAALVQFHTPWCRRCEHFALEYARVGNAAKNSDKVVVATLNAEQFPEIAERFSVSGYPTYLFFSSGSLDPEPIEQPADAVTLTKILNDKVHGCDLKLSQEQSYVKELDPSTFYSVALNPSKHVFVEFYATWCERCARIAPNYERLGLTYVNEPDVVIARIECTESASKDIGHKYGMQGFPYFVWFPKDNKKGTPYHSTLHISGLVQFVNNGAGIRRQVGGDLDIAEGTTHELRQLALKYMKADDEARKDILDVVKKDPDRRAQSYAKIMERIEKDGEGYVDKENSRLKRMLGGKSLNMETVDEFQKKINVLTCFK
mmetsp:Transcript_34110/g.46680  ORF Transcript_34110/g.46680 Transcript_34110/m.46680 type:complete len:369 (+) Transcript_34110:80-1186(+)|eukprot:CAMPEP_0201479478 /NCGR_PEP_ID=MMETSP0151_2-20130828/4172_1 /ASSEMBLY_ACC=CAM_ASM_000257 /TAXON_ID=200890 /ORGANISM="Paramoeba atlantica, Strain 621/1 / CCAP 1560/9" /LENGTH=368 /DNA_ID=CAMNT_0047860989 /DNA_START=65 /DNA_END=1171 /DNA_ORIENTATION=+